jgi:crossover junction endodeoxyribonuclease RuvC
MSDSVVRCICGIDPGLSGAIAILTDSGELVDVHEMPCLHDGPAGRRIVNGPLLASIVSASHADQAFVEYVGARPGEGAVGAFAFGRSRGVIEGVWPPLASPARS